jgi:seryl-tRNA synthetase
MSVSVALVRRISEVEPPLREVLWAILEEMERQRAQWEESVTKTEFNELKEIVRDLGQTVRELAEAQKRTEERVNELAEAQKRTEERVGTLEQTVRELAEAQKRTEEEIRKLTKGLQQMRSEVGGLSRSVSYALENEAYRYLPRFLKERHGIEVLDRIIRTYVDTKEVNIFGRVRKGGEEMYLVGEAVLKLDSASKLKQVWDTVMVVKQKYGVEVLPIIVTHFARPEVLEKAGKAGILVVQSFEWI